MTEPRSVRASISIVTGCCGAAASYAIIRVLQANILREPDPAAVMWSAHAGFFWRSWTAGYLGGMVAFVAWFAAGRDAPRTARFVARGVVVAAILIALQGVLVP